MEPVSIPVSLTCEPCLLPSTASGKTSSFSWTDLTVPTVSGYRTTVCTTWGNVAYILIHALYLSSSSTWRNERVLVFFPTVRTFWSWPQTFPGTSSCQWEHVLGSSQRPLSSACTSQLWTSWLPMQRWPWVHPIYLICVSAAIICIPSSLPCLYQWG